MGSDCSPNRGRTVANERLPEVEERTDHTGDIAAEQNLDAAAEENLEDQFFHTQRDGPSSKEDGKNLSSRPSSRCIDAELSRPEDKPNKGKERVACVLDDEGCGRDSQEIGDVTDIVEHQNDPDLVTFEMVRNGSRHSSDHPQTQGSPIDTAALCPIYSGDSTHEVGKDARTSQPLSSEHFEHCGDVDHGYYTEEDIEDISDTKQRDVELDQGQLLAPLEILEMSYPSSLYKARSIIKNSFDDSVAQAATSTWHQETTDDQSEPFLSDRVYIDEMQCKSPSTVKSCTVEKASPSIRTASDHGSLHSWCEFDVDASKAEHYGPGIIGEEILSTISRGPVSPKTGKFTIDSPAKGEISQIRSHKCKPNDHGEGVICSRVSYERYPIDGHEGSV